MANICSDDVYFYSDKNPKGLQDLWEDLYSSLDRDPSNSWIGCLFQYKGIITSGICLRGMVTYMERNDDGILLDISAAWSPLYDAYRAISEHYDVSFVCKSIKPGEGIYFNTDINGRYFPERYLIQINGKDEITPLGKKVTEVLTDWALFESEQELINYFRKLGYDANSLDALDMLLEEQDIRIHAFENPLKV